MPKLTPCRSVGTQHERGWRGLIGWVALWEGSRSQQQETNMTPQRCLFRTLRVCQMAICKSASHDCEH